MKKRPLVQLEELETRVTPDVALGHSASALIQPPANGSAPIVSQPSVLPDLPVQASPHGSSGPFAGGLVQDAGYLQALGRIFANSNDLEKLFHSAPRPLTESSQDAGESVWQFISNYCKKAIGNDELKYGLFADHEDIIHQVYVEWREQVGTSNSTLSNVLTKDSAARQALRKTVRRVPDHARYESAKQRRMIELVDHPAPADPARQEWIDMQIDWSSIGLSGREKQMLLLRRQGMTFDEIGSEMGLVKQRVSEIYNSALVWLQDLYAEPDGGEAASEGTE